MSSSLFWSLGQKWGSIGSTLAHSSCNVYPSEPHTDDICGVQEGFGPQQETKGKDQVKLKSRAPNDP